MKKLGILMSLGLLLLLSSCAPQGANKWVLIGERVMGFPDNHDFLSVGADRGQFTGLKFRVKRAPIHVLSIEVTYGNGNQKKFAIGKRFSPGSESRVFDLPGQARVIRNIQITYKPGPRARKRGVIKVLGRR